MREELAEHDREALLEQAAHKTALASDLRCPRDPSWYEHLTDAIEAYERAGYEDKAADVRRMRDQQRISAAASAKKSSDEAPAEPQGDAEDLGKPAKRSRR